MFTCVAPPIHHTLHICTLHISSDNWWSIERYRNVLGGRAKISLCSCGEGHGRLIFWYGCRIFLARHGKCWQCKRCRLGTRAEIFSRAEHYQIRRSRHPILAVPCQLLRKCKHSCRAVEKISVRSKNGAVFGLVPIFKPARQKGKCKHAVRWRKNWHRSKRKPCRAQNVIV